MKNLEETAMGLESNRDPTPRSRTSATLLALLAIAMSSNAISQSAKSRGQVATRLLPVALIKFEPLVINKIEVEAPTYPIDEPGLRSKMSKQFDEWIVRSITRQHLAKAAEPLSVASPRPGGFVLRTVLNVPLTHAAKSSHYDNAFRRGKFMDYNLILSDSSGKVVAESHGGLVWGDGNWATFALRRRTMSAHDDVVLGYVRRAVDRGVGALRRQMEKQ